MERVELSMPGEASDAAGAAALYGNTTVYGASRV